MKARFRGDGKGTLDQFKKPLRSVFDRALAQKDMTNDETDRA